jgi:NADH dehydrogenase
MAGAIAELSRFAMTKDFDHIHPELARVILIEAGPRLLAAFPENIAKKAVKPLGRLGIQIRVNERVTGISEAGVTTTVGFIPARTVIWAAGVEPSPLAKDLGVPLDRAGRVFVEPDLSVPGHPEIFVAGDLAAVKWKNEEYVPGMAPGAMQEGRHAARNIIRRINRRPTEPFHYVHKGSMATIGRSHAVVDLGLFGFAGFLAWVTWLVIHIFYLIGFRNRFLVLFQWAWSYLTFQRGTRLITGNHARLTSRKSIPHPTENKPEERR